MTKVDVKQLLEAGAHFGHKVSKWNPKMGPYIHSARNDVHIIDLTKTVEKLEEAVGFLEETASSGKQILIVGTKKQAKDIVQKMADDTKSPYVNVRWLGGLLTNWQTMSQRVKHLKSLEERDAAGELESRYSKLEVQRLREEVEALNISLGGVKELKGMPGAVLVLDIVDNNLAVAEANKLGIPVVGVADTNSDPSSVDYPIPANDDAIKSLEAISAYLQAAISTGKASLKAKPVDEVTKVEKPKATKKAEAKKDETKKEDKAEEKKDSKKDEAKEAEPKKEKK